MNVWAGGGSEWTANESSGGVIVKYLEVCEPWYECGYILYITKKSKQKSLQSFISSFLAVYILNGVMVSSSDVLSISVNRPRSLNTASSVAALADIVCCGDVWETYRSSALHELMCLNILEWQMLLLYLNGVSEFNLDRSISQSYSLTWFWT